ncbi:uncharacterized protein LOC118176195 [Oxyura jamaicensis]|uniref:uncharacterized protein LOC118176195 n=1 Tax=Oxyura jamaicensis TaxID=8884 RepID=UPI0015A6C128|nr:uncharacterized protein LOC118176195 [Oxyura jamaicensis]
MRASREALASSQNLARASSGAGQAGNGSSPRVQAQSLELHVPEAAVLATSLFPLHLANSAGMQCSKPRWGAPNLTCLTPDSVPHVMQQLAQAGQEGLGSRQLGTPRGPNGVGSRVRPVAPLGPRPGWAAQQHSGCTACHTCTKAPGRFPCSTPSTTGNPPEGSSTTGSTGHLGGLGFPIELETPPGERRRMFAREFGLTLNGKAAPPGAAELF